jgi:hypothetical protein
VRASIEIAGVPFRRDPADSLADNVENAEPIEQYLAGVDLAAFARNDLLCDAVEHCIERVGEAVHRLGERAAELMPNQPWGAFDGCILAFSIAAADAYGEVPARARAIGKAINTADDYIAAGAIAHDLAVARVMVALSKLLTGVS